MSVFKRELRPATRGFLRPAMQLMPADVVHLNHLVVAATGTQLGHGT